MSVNRHFISFLSCLAVILCLASCTSNNAIKQEDSGLILCDSFEISLDLNLGQDVGQRLGTLFVLRDTNGNIAAGAGFNNDVNTFKSSNRLVLSVFITDELGKVSSRSIGNPYASQNVVPRIFAWRDTLFAFKSAFASQNPMPADFSYFDVTKKVWLRYEQTLPPVQNVSDVQLIAKNLVIVTADAIYHGLNKVYSSGQQYYINSFTVRNGQYLVYQVAHDPSLPNLIEIGKIEITSKDFRLIKQKEYQLELESPSAYFAYTWQSFRGHFLLATNYGDVFKVNKDSIVRFIQKEREDLSYQLYGSLHLGDSLLFGHYPSGNLHVLKPDTTYPMHNAVPIAEYASPVYREAQSVSLYAGRMIVGVWPWGEIWARSLNQKSWQWVSRVFKYPPVTREDAPFVERFKFNQEKYMNAWGQRVVDMVKLDSSLYVSTSWKNKMADSLKQYLFPKEIEQYGQVHQILLPYQLNKQIDWKESTLLKFKFENGKLRVYQDDNLLGQLNYKFSTNSPLKLDTISAIYGTSDITSKKLKLSGLTP